MIYRLIWAISFVAIFINGCGAADGQEDVVGAATPTVSTSLSSQDQAFVSHMASNVETAGHVLAQFDVQVRLAEDDPSLVSDDKWREDTAGALMLLERTGHDLQQYDSVPPDLAPLNEECVALGKSLVAVATDYAKGIDEHSISRLAASVEDRRAADARFQKVTEELDALGQR